MQIHLDPSSTEVHCYVSTDSVYLIDRIQIPTIVFQVVLKLFYRIRTVKITLKCWMLVGEILMGLGLYSV